MDIPKVSICVPVYNTAHYLPQCFGSLLSQTLQEIEILLVDDGSTDESGQICGEYAQRDSRIRVFHKENGGLASVRQYALEHANGEYFISCDSDDWVELSMYEELYRKAKEEDADMVLCDFFYNYSDGRQLQANNIPTGCSQDALLRDVLMRRITGATWNKLVRTDIYRRYNLSWEKGVNLGEDVFMFFKLLQYPLRVSILPKPFYHYRRILGGNTYTNNLTFSSFKQAERIHIWKVAHINQAKYGREMFASTLDYAFIGIRANDMPVKYYDSFVTKYLPYREFFSYRLFTKKYFLILLSKLLGLSSSKFVFHLLYRFVYK